MRLFLIRHGETAWTVAKRYQGMTDIPLNQKGLRQAKFLARVLAPERPARIYSSTLRRSRETAQVMAAALKLRPVPDPRLNELHFGEWEGALYRNLARTPSLEFRRWREGKLDRPPGGESVASLMRRVGKFLKEILERHREETVAVVSHGGPIKMFLFHALKSLGSSIWSFRIDPASVSLIEGDQRLLQITWTNRTDHLS